ncbi:MAG: hypothetical protein ACTSQ2_09365 [Candidatus Heimdallarchaeaceae archaeon]
MILNLQKKKILVLLCVTLTSSIVFLSGSHALQQSVIVIENPILDTDSEIWSFTGSALLGEGSGSDSTRPNVVTDSKGNIHAVWKEDNGTYIYRRYEIGPRRWMAPEALASVTPNGFAQINLAVDALDNVHFVWGDDTNYDGAGIDFDIFYKYWDATALRWNETSVVSTESALSSMMPEVKVDQDFNVHVVWYDLTDYLSCGTDYDVFYKCWDASNMKWNTTMVVSSESDRDSKRPSFDIQSTGMLEIAWYDGSDLGDVGGTDWDIFFKYYNPATGFLSSIITLSETINGSYHPDVYVDTKDNVHVVWSDYTDFDGAGEDPDIFYKMWNRTALSWTGMTVVSTESDDASLSPGIVVDELQNVYVAWADQSDIGVPDAFQDIFFKICNGSVPGFWTTTQVLTNDNLSDASISDNVPIDMDPWGNVYVLWEDYSDMLDSGTDLDIFYTRITLDNLRNPVLHTISPNPSSTGNIDMFWESVPFAQNYSVYREVSTISSVTGLTPIAVVTSPSLADPALVDGTYYYVIVAANPYLTSDLSNEESVIVEILVFNEYPVQLLLAIGIVGSITAVALNFRNKKRNKL